MLNPQGYVTHPAPLGKTDTGGQTLYVLQLAKALGEQGIKVDIFVRQFKGLEKNEKPWPNVEIIRIPSGPQEFLPKEKLYEEMPVFVENIMHYLEKTRKKYQLIHSHYWDGGYGGIIMSKMLDIPHVHTPHPLGKLKKIEMDVQEAPVKKLKPMYRYHVRIAIEQKIMNKANAVVVICETSRIQILQHYMVDFEKINVIFPGIDTKYFNTKKNHNDNKYALKHNSILTVSRLVPAKGIDRVIDAVSYINKKIDFHLYIAGGSSNNQMSKEEIQVKDQLNMLIKKHRLQNKVSFLGFVDHDHVLPAIYRNADLFILGGRYEPFGLTTMEAMACETVPLVSKVAGSREIIIDGLNGYIIDTSKRKEMASLILKLLEDKKLKNKVAQNAAFTVEKHYSWDKISKKFLDLYNKLLK